MMNILLTDGEFTGMIRALRDYNSEIRIIGFCSSEYCAHTAMLDAFYVAPDDRNTEYYSFLEEAIKKENIDYIFPVGTLSLEFYAEHADEIYANTGALVISSGAETIKVMNNKALLYQALSNDSELSFLIPDFKLARTYGELRSAVKYFESRGISCASKPVRGENAEGFLHFVNAQEFSKRLLTGQASHLCCMESFSSEADDGMLPEERLVMPFLTGKEYDADVLSLNGKVLALTIRENKEMFGGLSSASVTVCDKRIADAVSKIIRRFDYSYLACISFKEDSQGNLYLLEINPRAMGSIYVSTMAGNSLVTRLFDVLNSPPSASAKPVNTRPGFMASLYYDLVPVSEVVWKELKAGDREIYEKYYAMADTQITDYSFGCRFAWDEVYRLRWAVIEDCLVQISFGEVTGFPFMLMPMGEYDEAKLARIVSLVRRDFDARGITFRIACIDEKYLEMYQNVLGQNLSFLDDFSDYIYEAEKLRSLVGREFSKKRNHISQFMRKYPDFKYVSLSKDLKNDCLDLIRLWAENKDIDLNDMDNSDYLMIKRVFENWDELNYRGGAIIVDGKVCAFSIASLGFKDTAFIHFEKANAAYDGSYAAINKLVLENEFPDAQFVNREEDLGIPGLRQSKESYFPLFKLRKYRN